MTFNKQIEIKLYWNVRLAHFDTTIERILDKVINFYVT
jgi:hypothetical protein